MQPWRVVPPASDGMSRVPPYSRIPPQARPVSPTGLSPAAVAPSSSVRLPAWFVTCSWHCRTTRWSVQPPLRNAGRLSHAAGFGSSRFVRHYSGNDLFSSGYVRCFSSPGSLDWTMDSSSRDAVSPAPGCPIRTPSVHRLPAAPRGVSSRGHVLRRPHPPRHPPCAFVLVNTRLRWSLDQRHPSPNRGGWGLAPGWWHLPDGSPSTSDLTPTTSTVPHRRRDD
jgi:hypothetical protein